MWNSAVKDPTKAGGRRSDRLWLIAAEGRTRCLWCSNPVVRPKYERLYQEQLALLDPAKVWADLHELTGEHEPVLLCWERPPALISGKTFCHRRLVAEYFRRIQSVHRPL